MSNYETHDLTRHIASQVRGLMAKYGVSQGDLARAIGVSQSQLSKMVRGTKPITIDQFDAMCRALGADPAEMLDEAQSFLADFDRDPSALMTFVGDGVRLPEPFVYEQRDLAPIIPIAEGRKRSTVRGAADTQETRRQRDYGRVAFEEDETGEDTDTI